MFKIFEVLKERLTRRKTRALKIAELEETCKNAAQEHRSACQNTVAAAFSLQGAVQVNAKQQKDTVRKLKDALENDDSDKKIVPSKRKTQPFQTLDMQGQGA